MTSRGLLIVLEGGDGSGKSTQSSILAERLGAVLTRQAGGTAFGKKLRDITLDPSSADLSLRAEALLYMADRAEHVDKVVRPALDAGKHVVSDRWAYSSFVYQGYGRGLDVEELRRVSDWSMDGLWPDVVVLLDIPLQVGSERLDGRGGAGDHYEQAGAELQRAVTEGYRQLAAEDPQRWQIVDGTGTVEEVAESIWEVISPVLESAKLPR